MKRSTILVLLLVLAMISQAEENKIKMLKSARAMKQEILQRISIGSGIEEAQKVMEANGFTCKKKERASFSEQDNDEKPTLHENIDYLYCDKALSESQYCARRWQVAIIHTNGVVSDILVSTGLICV